MATVHIILRDTEDGQVEAETTVTAWEEGSNAIALANRVNEHMAEISQPAKEEPKLVLVSWNMLTMHPPAVYRNCIGTMATVCQANALILKKMSESGEFPKDQVDLARQTAQKSLRVLDRLILSYLRGL